jgi:PKD repeat protein
LEGEAPLTVNFTDESIDGTSPITSREWSFGDGGVSDESDPVHVYDLPGTYTVSLIVGSEHGSNASIREDYITVTEAGLEGEGES